MRLAATLGIAFLAAGHSDVTVGNAAPRVVQVLATDYAFQVPASLPAGPTTFRFSNKSNHKHELNIFLLRPGVTVTQVLELQRAGKSTKDLVEAPLGVLFVSKKEPNAPATLTTNLLPGRQYGVICILRDSAKATRHFDLGMYSTITVENKPAASQSLSRADVVVGMDYAFNYPRTVSPGKHSFSFRNSGKQRHEMSITLLKPGVTLAKIIEVDKVDGDIDPFIESGMGLLWARGGGESLARLEFEMLPGREYMIDCGFQDDDKSPPHYKLGMYGSIRVSGKPRG